MGGARVCAWELAAGVVAVDDWEEGDERKERERRRERAESVDFAACFAWNHYFSFGNYYITYKYWREAEAGNNNNQYHYIYNNIYFIFIY
jgi:hypothetical protein